MEQGEGLDEALDRRLVHVGSLLLHLGLANSMPGLDKREEGLLTEEGDVYEGLRLGATKVQQSVALGALMEQVGRPLHGVIAAPNVAVGSLADCRISRHVIVALIVGARTLRFLDYPSPCQGVCFDGASAAPRLKHPRPEIRSGAMTPGLSHLTVVSTEAFPVFRLAVESLTNVFGDTEAGPPLTALKDKVALTGDGKALHGLLVMDTAERICGVEMWSRSSRESQYVQHFLDFTD